MPTFPTPRPDHGLRRGRRRLGARRCHRPRGHRGAGPPTRSEPGFRCQGGRRRAHRLPERDPGRIGGQAIRLHRPWRRRDRGHRIALAFATSGVFGVGEGARRRRVRRVPVLHGQWGRSRRQGCRETSRPTARLAISLWQDLTGAATISSASGDATVGELVGDVRFRAASGSLVASQPRSTATVAVQTGSGDVEVGVPEGTAARLDLRTGSGEVRNSLQPSDGPADGDETLTVHVRTGSGDIRVQRATASVVG